MTSTNDTPAVPPAAAPRPITRVLVANRGEIARRVFRTCRDLGFGTVAVFSDADAGSPHVADADAAVRLPGDAPADTYLRIDLLLDAARATGADAVHPGYGFLSENAEFARAVLDAGLVWIGPPPAAIEAMGSKVAAKRLMADAGVPVLGSLGPDGSGSGGPGGPNGSDGAGLGVTEADLPVLVKASAGGGGRGMRIVRTLAELPAALDAARAEAASAFGDPTVFCEPYLETGRHIEVQVVADAHGAVHAYPERECSIQRRHQKVIEESPSPLVTALTARGDDVRSRLADAAVTAARAIGYVGAGTVEFLAADDGRFFFLETNTRLQVEHPVTEAVTGADLVRLQIEIAEGAALPAEPPAATGHAIEARLYAEDPARDWSPQVGALHRLHVPGVDAEFAPVRGLRLDSGVHDGSAASAGVSLVSPHYDAMLAKVIAWAPTRVAAARRLAAALAGARVHGVTTNRDLLVRVLRSPGFLAGDTDTAFLTRHADLVTPPARDPGDGTGSDRADRDGADRDGAVVDIARVSALAAALADAARNRARGPQPRSLPSGWRNVASQPQRKAYEIAGETVEVAYRLTRDGLDAGPGVALVDATPTAVVLDVAGVRRRFDVATYGDVVCVDSDLGAVTLRAVPRFPRRAAAVAAGSLVAPMPGAVVEVRVTAGGTVRAGEPVVVLEAMKMRHVVTAPADGVVTALPAAVGAQVDAGAVLAVVTADPDRPATTDAPTATPTAADAPATADVATVGASATDAPTAGAAGPDPAAREPVKEQP